MKRTIGAEHKIVHSPTAGKRTRSVEQRDEGVLCKQFLLLVKYSGHIVARRSLFHRKLTGRVDERSRNIWLFHVRPRQA